NHMTCVFIFNDLPYDVRNSIRQLPVFTFKDQSHSGPGGIYQALILIIRNFPAFYIFILAEFFCAIYAAVFPVIIKNNELVLRPSTFLILFLPLHSYKPDV